MSSPPLAHLLRPKNLADFEGLANLDRHFVQLIAAAKGAPPSAIFWGPPGSGKTTLARIIGAAFDCNFIELSAVLSGVKDLREVVENAKSSTKPTLLFVDEIHRFNKGQQDAFLPHVEAGTIALVGATTDNPSFYLTRALLSRCRVLVLPSLGESALRAVLKRASSHLSLTLTPESEDLVCHSALGDGRRLINILEGVFRSLGARPTSLAVQDFLSGFGALVYDRDGEEHYNIISAFIKSLRGSDSDAALYYCFRMLEAGEDPLFVIRRMIIFASEDIGNADPRALQIAVSTLQAFQAIGLPEGRIPIAQCVTYLATAPKSNRSYAALGKALELIKDFPAAPVPLHLRNAPTALMKGLGYGSEYRYPHEEVDGFARGVRYLPEALGEVSLYQPSDRGYEKQIGERLEWLKGRRPENR